MLPQDLWTDSGPVADPQEKTVYTATAVNLLDSACFDVSFH